MNDQDHRARTSLPRERALRPVAEISRRVAIITGRGAPGDRFAETLRQLRRLGAPVHRRQALGGVELEELDESHDLVHLCASGPLATAALARAQELGVPVVASPGAAGPVLGACRLVLSPTRAADAALLAAGVGPARIARWQPGIDRERFGPAHYSATAIPTPPGAATAPFHVLYAGPLERASGVGLLAEAVLRARVRDPRLTLVLAGHGAAEAELRRTLRGGAVFLGPLEGMALAGVYASAELCVCPGTGPEFGDGVLAAQASGLPVLAIEGSGAGELIESGRSGCLVAPDPDALAAAIVGLARRAALRERLSTGGLPAAARRSWERSLAELAAWWEHALRPLGAEVTRAA